MLNISKTESVNECYITGTLNELDVVTDTSKSTGKDFVRGTAYIRVDQVINGKPVENIIPIKLFSMKEKKDGTPNPNYDRIIGYKNNLISLAIAEQPSQASRLTVSGKTCNIRENSYADKTTGQIRSSFEIDSNFLNTVRADDEDEARFVVVGVLLDRRDEFDRDGNETGRGILSLGIVQYGGKIDVVQFIVTGEGKVHAETNWNIGDTIQVSGRINMSSKIVEWDEEQGFGEPIHHKRTESYRELLITGGSPSGLDEDVSYDADDVKAACAERKARLNAMLERNKSTAPTANAKQFSF